MSVKRFDPEDILISTETVSVPMWSNDTDKLDKSEMQLDESKFRFYKDVYFTSSTTSSAEESESIARVQFAIAWGHRYGLGSQAFMDSASSGMYEASAGHTVASPSSVIWGQYRNLILGDEEDTFHFGYGKSVVVSTDPCAEPVETEPITVSDATQIFAISIDRARYKEKLRPGSLELKVSASVDGEEKVITLIDDSGYAESERYLDCGRVYDLVEQLDSSSVSSSISYGPSGSYGYLLPDIGVILLNGDAFEWGQNTGSLYYDSTGSMPNNADKLYDNLVSIRLQSEETVTSNFVFVRARNAEFNYSTNPSNIFADGELRHNIMINSPQAFITTVGLYNDNNDLLAVAKLSKPLVKDFTKEALIRIKLDY